MDGPTACWRALEVVPRTGSTNGDLVARARAGEDAGLVLLADDQVAGRGRLTRVWAVPPRSSIAVSVLLRPEVDRARWGWIALLTGLAVVDALGAVCGLDARLKWPNDVLLTLDPSSGTGSDSGPRSDSGTSSGSGSSLRSGSDDGEGSPESGVPGGIGRRPDTRASADTWGPAEREFKVAGILAEVVAVGAATAVVVGTGINVSQRADELPVPTATSLALAGARTTDRDTVARAFLRSLAARLARWQDADGDPARCGLWQDYGAACVTVGRSVQVHLPGGRRVDGTAEGVDEDGCLQVRDTNGVLHHLAAGDVVHVRPGTAGDLA